MKLVAPLVLALVASSTIGQTPPPEPRPYLYLWTSPTSGFLNTQEASRIVVSWWCDDPNASAQWVGEQVRHKALQYRHPGLRLRPAHPRLPPGDNQ